MRHTGYKLIGKRNSSDLISIRSTRFYGVLQLPLPSLQKHLFEVKTTTTTGAVSTYISNICYDGDSVSCSFIIFT